MRRDIPGGEPSLVWERALDVPLARWEPAVGDGVVVLVTNGNEPAVCVVAEVATGREVERLAPPEKEWRAGPPAISSRGDFVVPIEGNSRDGLYVARGGRGVSARIEVVDPPVSAAAPERHSGTELWAVPTDAGFVFRPRDGQIEWRFDGGDRARSFLERPCGVSDDVVVTIGERLRERDEEAVQREWLHGPTFRLFGGSFRAGGERFPAGERDAELVFRRREDGTRIGSSIFCGLVSISGGRTILRMNRALLTTDAGDVRAFDAEIPIEGQVTSVAQAPGVLAFMLMARDRSVRLLRYRDDGVLLGDTSLGMPASARIVAIDHTRLLYEREGVLCAEPIAEPGAVLWRLTLPPGGRGVPLALAIRDGFLVAHDGSRVFVWAGS